MLSPSIVQFLRMRDDGKPALIFTAHLANWEIPAVAAAAHGARCTIVVRPPNSRVAAIIAEQLRETSMGRLVKSQPMAAFALAAEIERGSHVGMLVDQFWRGGPLVTFFGRECPVNPTIARLARRFECEVRGTRIVRLPGNRFSVDLTPPLELPRDDAGKVDVAATMQMITTIVEGWIREYPEQWLWLHRRWRDYS
jgi:KDO2-lipid IV(A) lauroyltransferase